MIGLALSGGGYRASLYHLGVMARLADEGLLKEVHALSTVSGGSIVGAFYYKMLCEELQRDRLLTDQDYRNLMQRVIGAFLPVVQEDLRDHVVLSGAISRMFPKPVCQLLWPITRRFPKLAPYLNPATKFDSKLAYEMNTLIFESVVLRDLMAPPVHPANKKPELIMNTSILENGQPLFISTDRRSPLWQLNEQNHSIRVDEAMNLALSTAAAASACVPGLFDPIRIPFGDRVVHGVDGGVLDNLGGHAIQLLEQDGMQVLLSDASKPLRMENYPEVGSAESFFRIQDLFMNAIRDLRIGGTDDIVIDMCNDIPGIDPAVRTLAMNMRTDLNAFSEVEAYTLMYVGYHACGEQIGKLKGPSISEQAAKRISGEQWPFMAVREYAEMPSQQYLRLLGQKEPKRHWLPELTMPLIRRYGYSLFYLTILAFISVRHGLYDAIWYVVLFPIIAATLGGTLLLKRQIAKGKRKGTMASLAKKNSSRHTAASV
ncbi:patatin-like phospholipase family protein [Paenibacillus sp. CCS19]|uniref:patatin-like phospholipase family protein n=1 Tax=Paenibacillus sp. CCS19 TaxID=3158387 RepID=UPI00295E8043|nr:patatin-like phospholipase family protein [Paenibacillus cellulosilyticus]